MNTTTQPRPTVSEKTDDLIVMVLGDGETFGTAEACAIVSVPDSDYDMIEEALDNEGRCNDTDGPVAATLLEFTDVTIEDGVLTVKVANWTDMPVNVEVSTVGGDV